MVKVMHEITKQLNNKHPGGGAPFFNELDSVVSNSLFFDELIRRMKQLVVTRMVGVVCTGEFGQKFFDHCMPNCQDEFRDIHVVIGNLRQGEEVKLIRCLDYPAKVKNYIFIDDSYYSGSTSLVVQKYLADEYKAAVLAKFVVYDGSNQTDNCWSIYRYFNYWDGQKEIRKP